MLVRAFCNSGCRLVACNCEGSTFPANQASASLNCKSLDLFFPPLLYLSILYVPTGNFLSVEGCHL